MRFVSGALIFSIRFIVGGHLIQSMEFIIDRICYKYMLSLYIMNIITLSNFIKFIYHCQLMVVVFFLQIILNMNFHLDKY